MQRDLKAIRDGSIGGCIGTLTMSTFMVGAYKAGLMGRHPPEEIAEAALDALGMEDRKEEVQESLAVALHFAFGAGAGALFGVLHRRLQLPIHPVIHGVVFGTLVWAGSYKGWIPAMGIMPHPKHDRPGRPGAMLVAHWIYGSTLGSIVSCAEDKP